jgi:hypothetical protein
MEVIGSLRGTHTGSIMGQLQSVRRLCGRLYMGVRGRLVRASMSRIAGQLNDVYI